jgi:ketosteroid isomerase-like protein
MGKRIPAAFLVLSLCAIRVYSADPSRADHAAVRKVLATYVAEWLAGHPVGVMRQLTADSVMVPGEKPAIVGRAAIQQYWWPANGPAFRLDRYTTTIDQIIASGDTATVRGTQVIAWTSGGEHWTTHGNYLTVLQNTQSGWRIALQMAANAPNERVAAPRPRKH